ncbi:unnamed protein product [Clonostachys rhizophaga]|uniref:Uncharacterized protein n=1 Tax=Clonostachys rhizophaga TaxID=160324 RepID=A0A9N9YSE7_9HYPO|nr:unnamed protein product [Clonostachys rhizophaga]
MSDPEASAWTCLEALRTQARTKVHSPIKGKMVAAAYSQKSCGKGGDKLRRDNWLRIEEIEK